MGLQSAIMRIKAAVKIRELIGESIKLERRSSKYVGLCPFHNENTPSFYVYDDNYFCFGCQESGDAIEFIQKTRHVEFIEALKILSKKYSVPCPELDKPTRNNKDNFNKHEVYKSLQLSLGTYKKNLNNQSDDSNRWLQYLKERGFTSEHIELFEFGLSSHQKNQISKTLQSQNLSRAGVLAQIIKPSHQYSGGEYDFFRERLMIPIHDKEGRVIAFGARAWKDAKPKYINSPAHPLYDKKATLYNYHNAKDSIQKSKEAFVLEGYMDVIQMRKHGIENAVAVCGTQFSDQHLRLLSSRCHRIYFVFDGDEAGLKASLKAAEQFLQAEVMQGFVMKLPANEDPDSYLQKFGKEKFIELQKNAKPLLDWAFDYLMQKSGEINLPTLLQKKLLPWLRSISSPIHRSFLMNKIQDRTGISQEVLLQGMKEQNHPPKYAEPGPPKVPQTITSAPENIEFEYIAHIFHANPTAIDFSKVKTHLRERLKLDQFWHDFLVDMLTHQFSMKSIEDESKAKYHTQLWLDKWQPVVPRFIGDLQSKKAAFEGVDRMKMLDTLAKESKRRQIKEQITRAKTNISKFNRLEDREKNEGIQETLMMIHQLNQQLLQLDKDF